MAELEPPFEESRRAAQQRMTGHGRAGWLFVLRLLQLGKLVAKQILRFLLAIIIVFEEWGWRPLSALLARLARLKPIAVLEAGIVRLPPWPALAVFALPSLLLLPLKLLALGLIAKGHVIAASGLFIGAKLAGTAIVARLFQLTRPALMKLGWFARIYGIVMPWKEAMVAQVRASWAWRYGRVLKFRLKQAAKAAWHHWRPTVEPLLQRLRAIIRRQR